MEFLKNPWVVAAAGGGAALAAGLLIAWAIMAGSHKSAEPPPASQGGLVIVSGRDDDAKLDPNRPLRCFVGGQFVGELPLKVCAQRNGVATGSLDVGLDPAGALAATNGAGADITPLAPQQPPQPLPVIETSPPAAANVAQPPAAPAETAQGGETPEPCWREAPGGGWARLPSPLGLRACVAALFGDLCPGPGEVDYGHWNDQLLRVTAGRVDISSDNRSFRPLVDPWPPCASAPG